VHYQIILFSHQALQILFVPLTAVVDLFDFHFEGGTALTEFVEDLVVGGQDSALV
jgi:hypothetical protein